MSGVNKRLARKEKIKNEVVAQGTCATTEDDEAVLIQLKHVMGGNVLGGYGEECDLEEL
jgi:hypothetical protein